MLNTKQKTIISIIPTVIIILFAIVLFIDLKRINNDKDPIFAIEAKTYENGTEKYVGILYCVYKVKVGDLRRSSLPDYTYELVPWFTQIEDLTIFDQYT